MLLFAIYFETFFDGLLLTFKSLLCFCGNDSLFLASLYFDVRPHLSDFTYFPRTDVLTEVFYICTEVYF